MPDFNALWQQYQPVLQQYRDDISKREQDLSGLQASGNTFADRLKQRLASVKSIQEPAIQAKKKALEGAMNAPQQGRELFADIKNPLAREQAAQPMVSRAVADYGEASDRLKQIQTPPAELVQSAVNAQQAEQARVQGMLQAAQDRYSMLRDEFQLGYQMAQDEWDRNMQEQQFAFQKAQANRSGGGGSKATDKTDDIWEFLDSKASEYATNLDENGNPVVDEAKYQDYIFNALKTGGYDREGVDIESLRKRWEALPWVQQNVTWEPDWSNTQRVNNQVAEEPTYIPMQETTSSFSPGWLPRGLAGGVGNIYNTGSSMVGGVGRGLGNIGKTATDTTNALNEALGRPLY